MISWIMTDLQFKQQSELFFIIISKPLKQRNVQYVLFKHSETNCNTE